MRERWGSTEEVESGREVLDMETGKGICPKCGNTVTLTEFGRYLSKELSRFETFFEGWCPNCVERVVEHKALSGSGKYETGGPRPKIDK